MKIYIGNSGARKVIELAKKHGWGRVHVSNAWRNPEKGLSWFLDNGAYSCWINKKTFDDKSFEDSLIKIERSTNKPDFIVVPDIVADGMKSLFFSLKWIHKIPAGIPAYLAVQDGMNTRDVLEYIDLFDGIFVGGSLEWKMKTAKTWCDVAHSQDKKCHIGKVGTFRRLVWAKNIGADSVDSSTFVQAKPGTGFNRIFAALEQKEL